MNINLKIMVCFLSFLTVFTGCKKEHEVKALHIIKSELPSSPLAHEGKVELSSNQFTATVEDDWCSILVEDNSIQLRISNNHNNSNRSTLLRIKPNAGGKDIIIPITQVGMLFDITTPIEQLNFSLRGGDRRINIARNIDYKVEFDNDWLDYTVHEDYLIITAKAGSAPRQSVARIVYGGNTVSIPIKQSFILSYEEFLGECSISFINDKTINESKRMTLKATIEPKEHGHSFILTTDALPQMLGKSLNIEMVMDNQGKLWIKSGQLQAAEVVDPKYPTVKRLYLVGYDKDKAGFCPNTTTDYIGDPIYAEAGSLYKFSNPQGWFTQNIVTGKITEYAVHGLLVNGHFDTPISNSSRISSVQPYIYLLDLQLTK